MHNKRKHTSVKNDGSLHALRAEPSCISVFKTLGEIPVVECHIWFDSYTRNTTSDVTLIASYCLKLHQFTENFDLRKLTLSVLPWANKALMTLL